MVLHCGHSFLFPWNRRRNNSQRHCLNNSYYIHRNGQRWIITLLTHGGKQNIFSFVTLRNSLCVCASVFFVLVCFAVVKTVAYTVCVLSGNQWRFKESKGVTCSSKETRGRRAGRKKSTSTKTVACLPPPPHRQGNHWAPFTTLTPGNYTPLNGLGQLITMKVAPVCVFAWDPWLSVQTTWKLPLAT